MEKTGNEANAQNNYMHKPNHILISAKKKSALYVLHAKQLLKNFEIIELLALGKGGKYGGGKGWTKGGTGKGYGGQEYTRPFYKDCKGCGKYGQSKRN